MSGDYHADKQGDFIAEIELENGTKIRIEKKGLNPYARIDAYDVGIPDRYADLYLVAGTEWGDLPILGERALRVALGLPRRSENA